jgi:peptide deformylase
MIIIVQKDAPVLRQHAESVSLADIETPALKKVVADMKTMLDREEDGVAIAAPQIGVSLRVFVVSSKAFSYHRNIDVKNKNKGTDSLVEERQPEDLVFINPEIVKLSRKKILLHEGCLSVRWLYGRVLRADKATVRAYDETGKLFTRGGSGILAQIFQHEIDHLNGVLFVDTAHDLETITKEEQERQRQERENEDHG